MRALIQLIFGASLCVFAHARFSYEPGNCEISIFNVVQDIVKSELRAIVNPIDKYAYNKRIHYDLYTRKNPYKRQILKLGDLDALHNSNFNPEWPIRFSIHGWTGKSTTCSNAAIKDAYLSRGNFNVIIVDWSEYALDISYARLSKQLSTIAGSLAKFIKFLKHEKKISYDQIYLIGHSAGSHLSGLAGKILQPKRLGAIFALDPAGLSQLGLSAEYRLAPTDAKYVESIHSDTVLLGNPSGELSQASFFANWGQGQPQCPNATAAEFDFACDHFAALYYFAESVRNPKQFGAVQCPDKKSIEQHNCRCTKTTQKHYNNTNNITTKDKTNYNQYNSKNNYYNNANDDSVDNNRNNNDYDKAKCTAVAYMGGEPAIPKTGIYYFSTNPQSPFGLGNALVRIRPPTGSNYLRSSFLSQRIVDKIRIYN